MLEPDLPLELGGGCLDLDDGNGGVNNNRNINNHNNNDRPYTDHSPSEETMEEEDYPYDDSVCLGHSRIATSLLDSHIPSKRPRLRRSMAPQLDVRDCANDAFATIVHPTTPLIAPSLTEHFLLQANAVDQLQHDGIGGQEDDNSSCGWSLRALPPNAQQQQQRQQQLLQDTDALHNNSSSHQEHDTHNDGSSLTTFSSNRTACDNNSQNSVCGAGNSYSHRIMDRWRSHPPMSSFSSTITERSLDGNQSCNNDSSSYSYYSDPQQPRPPPPPEPQRVVQVQLEYNPECGLGETNTSLSLNNSNHTSTCSSNNNRRKSRQPKQYSAATVLPPALSLPQQGSSSSTPNLQNLSISNNNNNNNSDSSPENSPEQNQQFSSSISNNNSNINNTTNNNIAAATTVEQITSRMDHWCSITNMRALKRRNNIYAPDSKSAVYNPHQEYDYSHYKLSRHIRKLQCQNAKQEVMRALQVQTQVQTASGQPSQQAGQTTNENEEEDNDDLLEDTSSTGNGGINCENTSPDKNQIMDSYNSNSNTYSQMDNSPGTPTTSNTSSVYFGNSTGDYTTHHRNHGNNDSNDNMGGNSSSSAMDVIMGE